VDATGTTVTGSGFTENNELKGEDDDSKQERRDVHAVDKKDYASYPLIAKDIRKVYPGVNGRKPKVAN
jgi:ABC-type multidrug transport system ATPase subunit